MKVDFVKISPTENMTVLITSNVPDDMKANVAMSIMEYDSVYAEQAGFVEKPNIEGARAKLTMSGGEFCGNAVMSLAAYIAETDSATGKTIIPIEICGGIVNCATEKARSGYYCSVDMPVPERIDGNTVFFSGIVHRIIEVDDIESSREIAEATVDSLASETEKSAVGAILYSKKNSEIAPLVCVKGVSWVWERGCGSGSAAVACYTAITDKRDCEIELKQPGGTIKAGAKYENGRITKVSIAGYVKISCSGTANI